MTRNCGCRNRTISLLNAAMMRVRPKPWGPKGSGQQTLRDTTWFWGTHGCAMPIRRSISQKGRSDGGPRATRTESRLPTPATCYTTSPRENEPTCYTLGDCRAQRSRSSSGNCSKTLRSNARPILRPRSRDQAATRSGTMTGTTIEAYSGLRPR